MSWNGKYRVFVKYSIGVLFYGFLWICCINCYWSRSSWISRLETISNLYKFFYSPIYNFLMSWNGKYRVSIKYSIGVVFYGFLWISCINCYWSRRSWSSCWKTMFNLYIFFFSPLYIFFINWNGKYRLSVKYSIGVLFYGFLWISCVNDYWSRNSWISRLETNSNLYILFYSPFHNLFISSNCNYWVSEKYNLEVLF